MKIAICDDIQDEREQLAVMLKEYCAAKGIAVSCCKYDSGEALLTNYKPGSFALILLDIYMMGMTGIETAARLKSIDKRCCLTMNLFVQYDIVWCQEGMLTVLAMTV